MVCLETIFKLLVVKGTFATRGAVGGCCQKFRKMQTYFINVDKGERNFFLIKQFFLIQKLKIKYFFDDLRPRLKFLLTSYSTFF